MTTTQQYKTCYTKQLRWRKYASFPSCTCKLPLNCNHPLLIRHSQHLPQSHVDTAEFLRRPLTHLLHSEVNLHGGWKHLNRRYYIKLLTLKVCNQMQDYRWTQVYPPATKSLSLHNTLIYIYAALIESFYFPVDF